MAKHASALKQMRQSLKHRDRNRRTLSQLKSQIKKLRTALSAGKTGDEAKKLLAETVGEIDRAAKKGVIHDNAAARYKSRLSRRFNAALSAPRT